MRSSSALVPPGKPRKVFQKSPMALGNLGGRAEGIDVGHSKCHFSAIKILLELIAWNNSGGGILYCKPSLLMVLEKRVKIDFPTENPRSVERPQGCFHLEWKRLKVDWMARSRNAIPRKAETQSDLYF